MNESRGIWRGKRIDNGEWVEGHYVCLTDSKGNEHRIYTGYAETNCGDYYPDFYKIDPETLGECTTETDINKNLIFEGDIVTYRTEDGKAKGIVYWCNGAFWIENLQNEEEVGLLGTLMIFDVAVIGNKHDNPEMYDS